MFEAMAQYSVILVTGPQRSGTRIGARMIAADTGYQYLDERAVHTDSLYALVDHLRCEHVVIQCPALMRYVHMVGATNDFLAVVCMHRAIQDILASRERIGWEYAPLELAHYYGLINNGASAPEVKYKFWEQAQRGAILHPYDLEYESLRGHALWVDKEQRAGWRSDQTEIRC